MSNSVHRLRKEFERLSALAALDDLESEKEYDTQELDKYEPNTSYPIISNHKSNIIQLQTTNEPIKNKDDLFETALCDDISEQHITQKYPQKSIQSQNNIKLQPNNNESFCDYFDANSQLQTTQNLADDMNDKINAIKNQKDDEILKHQTKLEDIANKLKKKTALTQDLQKQIDGYRYKESEENKEMRETLIELETHLNENKQSKKELLQQNSSLQKQIDILTQELSNESDKINELNRIITENAHLYTQKEGQYHLQLQKANSDANCYEKEKKRILDKNEKLHVEISNIRKYSKELQQELNVTSKQFRITQNELISYQNKERKSNISIVSQLSLFTTQNQKLRKELNDKQINIDKLSKTNESLLKQTQTQKDHKVIVKDFDDFYDILLTLKHGIETKLELIIKDNDKSQKSNADFIRSDVYNKCINILNQIVLFSNQNQRNVNQLKKSETEIQNQNERNANQLKKSEEAIQNMANNFNKYHKLIEKKFCNLCENVSKRENEIENIKETMDKIQRESQQLQQNNMNEIEKYVNELDQLKDIKKEYDHLIIDHKHLQSKYDEMITKKGAGTRSRSGSYSFSIEQNNYGDTNKLKDEIYDLRKSVKKWENKWDDLKRTPAKYYVNNVDQKHIKYAPQSTDEYRHYW